MAAAVVAARLACDMELSMLGGAGNAKPIFRLFSDWSLEVFVKSPSADEEAVVAALLPLSVVAIAAVRPATSEDVDGMLIV